MKLSPRLVKPKSWPVRWRLSLVSAGLTLIILVLFGGLIGKIATERIRDDFNGEVSSAAKILAGQVQIVYPPFRGEPQLLKSPHEQLTFVANSVRKKMSLAPEHPLAISGDAIPDEPIYRLSVEQQRRLLDRPEVVHALGDDAVEQTRRELESIAGR